MCMCVCVCVCVCARTRLFVCARDKQARARDTRYKHSVTLLGACPNTSLDRCGACLGGDTACRACDGVTGSAAVVDWCGACGGDNSTCSGCLPLYTCQVARARPCVCARASAPAGARSTRVWERLSTTPVPTRTTCVRASVSACA